MRDKVSEFANVARPMGINREKNLKNIQGNTLKVDRGRVRWQSRCFWSRSPAAIGNLGSNGGFRMAVRQMEVFKSK